MCFSSKYNKPLRCLLSKRWRQRSWALVLRLTKPYARHNLFASAKAKFRSFRLIVLRTRRLQMKKVGEAHVKTLSNEKFRPRLLGPMIKNPSTRIDVVTSKSFDLRQRILLQNVKRCSIPYYGHILSLKGC